MILSKVIIRAYDILIEIALWLFLVAAFVGGWQGSGSILGGIAGLIGGFIFAVLFGGAFLVLNDIRRRVKVIEERGTA